MGLFNSEPQLTPEMIENFNAIQGVIPSFTPVSMDGTTFNEYYLGGGLKGWVNPSDPNKMLGVDRQVIGTKGLDGNWRFNSSVSQPQTSSWASNLAQYGGLALQGMQALGNLYMGNKMYGLAKDQFNFQKDFANRNLANSMKTYNNALADRINSRYAFEGRSQAEADDYLKKHSL